MPSKPPELPSYFQSLTRVAAIRGSVNLFAFAIPCPILDSAGASEFLQKGLTRPIASELPTELRCALDTRHAIAERDL